MRLDPCGRRGRRAGLDDRHAWPRRRDRRDDDAVTGRQARRGGVEQHPPGRHLHRPGPEHLQPTVAQHPHVAAGPLSLLGNRDQWVATCDVHVHLDEHAPQQRPRRRRRRTSQGDTVPVERPHVARLAHEHATRKRARLLVEAAPLLTREHAVPFVGGVSDAIHHVGRRAENPAAAVGHAAPDPCHVGHLETRPHLDGTRVLDRHQGRPLGDERSLFHPVLDDHPIDRCRDSGSFQVEPGLLQHRAGKRLRLLQPVAPLGQNPFLPLQRRHGVGRRELVAQGAIIVRLGDDLAGPERRQPGDFPPRQVDLPPRDVDRHRVLCQFLVRLLDRQSGLSLLAGQSFGIEFVVPRVDFQEQAARLHEVPLVALIGLAAHAAGHLGRERDLAQRHHHAIGRDRQPVGDRLGDHGPHRNRRRRRHLLAGWGRLAAEGQKNAHARSEDDQRNHPACDSLERAHATTCQEEKSLFLATSGAVAPRAARENRVTWSAIACGA